MTSESQLQWVKQQLEDKGFITRNECLKNYISRLSSIIHRLKKRGYEIVGEEEKVLFGTDYKYRLIAAPKQSLNTQGNDSQQSGGCQGGVA